MLDCSCHSHSGFLTRAGYARVAQRTSREGLLPRGVDFYPECQYLDKVGSVSAIDQLDFIFDDAVLEEQHRRFHNGS